MSEDQLTAAIASGLVNPALLGVDVDLLVTSTLKSGVVVGAGAPPSFDASHFLNFFPTSGSADAGASHLGLTASSLGDSVFHALDSSLDDGDSVHDNP